MLSVVNLNCIHRFNDVVARGANERNEKSAIIVVTKGVYFLTVESLDPEHANLDWIGVFPPAMPYIEIATKMNTLMKVRKRVKLAISQDDTKHTPFRFASALTNAHTPYWIFPTILQYDQRAVNGNGYDAIICSNLTSARIFNYTLMIKVKAGQQDDQLKTQLP